MLRLTQVGSRTSSQAHRVVTAIPAATQASNTTRPTAPGDGFTPTREQYTMSGSPKTTTNGIRGFRRMYCGASEARNINGASNIDEKEIARCHPGLVQPGDCSTRRSIASSHPTSHNNCRLRAPGATPGGAP